MNVRNSSGYEPQNVVVLEGLESVRLRPGMYVGSPGAPGLAAMFFEVLSNAIDQHLAGHATRVSMELADDDTVTIEDDGEAFHSSVRSTAHRPSRPSFCGSITRRPSSATTVMYTSASTGSAWHRFKR